MPFFRIELLPDEIKSDEDFERFFENEESIVNEEIQYIKSQGVNIEFHKDNLLVVGTDKLEFKIFNASIIPDVDSQGKYINTFKEDTEQNINNSRIKIIVDYLKIKGVKHYTVKPFYITFGCPICNKTDQKMSISIKGFNFKTFSNTDCVDDNHTKKLNQWKKEIKKIWDESKDKKKLCFNLGIEYIKNIITNCFPRIYRNNSLFYRYDVSKKFYIELLDEDWDKLIYSYFIADNDTIITTNDLKNIKTYIKTAINFEDKKIQSENLLNFKNGIYNIDTKELIDHSNDYFFTYILPCDFNQNLINGRLETIVSDWGIDLLDLKKMLGYCFQSKNYLEKSFYLIGKPNCGKGTLLSFIKYMFSEKCNSITLNDLYDDFGTSDILNKTCLIDEDFDTKTFLKNDVKRFNKFVSGESFKYSSKYKNKFSIDSTMKFIIAGNDYPKFKSENDNGGFRRRIFYFEFKNQYVPGVNQDTNIKQEFKNNSELQTEFMNWIIEGLLLLKNHSSKNAFFDNQIELNDKIIRNAEPVIDYLLDNVSYTESNQDKLSTKDLMNNYKMWCNENCIDYPIGVRTLNKKLHEVFNIEEKNININMKFNGEQKRGTKGLKFHKTSHLELLKINKGDI